MQLKRGISKKLISLQNTGITMKASKRIQVNVAVDKVKDIK